MPTDSKEIAADLALVVICGLALAMIVIASIAAAGGLRGDVGLGSYYLAVMATMNDLKVVFWPAGIIVNAGLGLAGAAKAPSRLAKTTVVIAAFGILACLALHITVVQPNIARPIWAYSEFESVASYRQLVSADLKFLIWAAASLASGIAAILRIVIPKAQAS